MCADMVVQFTHYYCYHQAADNFVASSQLIRWYLRHAESTLTNIGAISHFGSLLYRGSLSETAQCKAWEEERNV